MASIIAPLDNSIYRIGQKVFFYSLTDTTWSLDPNNIILSNNVAVIEFSGTTTLHEINYNYCIVRFVGSGEFYLKTADDSITKTIYGIDVIWAGAKTTLWNTDIGRLCSGLTVNFNIQKINKWSLFKPIRSDKKELGEKDIWASSNLFKQNGAGMRIIFWDSFESPISFYSFLQDINSPYDTSWTYLPPRGISNVLKEYLRLGDFRGYTDKYNKSYISKITNVPTIYRKTISGEFKKENWDKYTLQNNNDPSSIKMSDIWLGTTEDTNLGEAYLMVYVRHLNRHFFKTIIKLSEQNTGEINIEIPLEELLDTLLVSDTYFEDKGTLERYYFVATNVKIVGTWIEFTETDSVYKAPSSVMKSKKYLTTLFDKAIALPITENSLKISNKILYYTEFLVNFTNAYSINRNVLINIVEESETKFMYFKKYNSLENNEIIFKNIFNVPNYFLKYKNCFRYDCLHVTIPGYYENWHRPTLSDRKNIFVNIKDLFFGIPELQWPNVNISLIEEYFSIEFSNTSLSKPIVLEILGIYSTKKLIIFPNDVGRFFNTLGSIYKMRNLSNYTIKIYTLNKDEIINENSITVLNKNPEVLTVTYGASGTDYITINVFTNIGNGIFDHDITPLSINVIVNI